MNVSLRLKLVDFLEHEEILIPMISGIAKTTQPFPIYFWYEDSADINSPTFQKFLSDWESKSGARYKTIIKKLDDCREFIWFDVCPNNKNLNSRFNYKYNNSGGIILGLKTFKECYDFTTKDKTVKKQKRNDYEDSNSRE
tara:strand:+ start:667 stop:1086 length:420 start_codon:yes stop_codon:yes gene_type:complete